MDNNTKKTYQWNKLLPLLGAISVPFLGGGVAYKWYRKAHPVAKKINVDTSAFKQSNKVFVDNGPILDLKNMGNGNFGYPIPEAALPMDTIHFKYAKDNNDIPDFIQHGRIYAGALGSLGGTFLTRDAIKDLKELTFLHNNISAKDLNNGLDIGKGKGKFNTLRYIKKYPKVYSGPLLRGIGGVALGGGGLYSIYKSLKGLKEN